MRDYYEELNGLFLERSVAKIYKISDSSEQCVPLETKCFYHYCFWLGL